MPIIVRAAPARSTVAGVSLRIATNACTSALGSDAMRVGSGSLALLAEDADSGAKARKNTRTRGGALVGHVEAEVSARGRRHGAYPTAWRPATSRGS